MKKLVLALLAPLLPAFCLAANNIKMVTYFPVPYASYSNLGVAGTCDVGLLNTCSLDSGLSLKVSKKGSAHALNSGAITVNSGTLSLDSSATEGKVGGSGLTAGTSLGASGSGSLEFKHNLTVNSMPSTIQSAEATNEAVMNSLTLFGQTFPGCDAANNKISWRNLTLNGENGVYLVCGAGEKAPEICTTNTQSENCCVKAGHTWVNDTCMHTCSSYKVLNEEYMTCGGPGCAKGDRYLSFNPTIGSCWAGGFWSMTQGQSLLSEVKNGVCDADEEWYYADAGRLGWEGLRKFMRITCEDQWPLEDFLYGDEETPERSCAFYSTSDRQGDNWGSGPICLVGTLSCKYQKSSWQCPVGKTCGKEVSSCL